MKKVLWVSRHEMTEHQFADLQRVLADEVTLCYWKETVQKAEDLLPAMEEADVIAVVLPLHLLSEVLKLANGKMVLQSVTERTLTDIELILEDGRKERDVRFEHKHWEQILKVEVCKKILS